MQAIKHNFRREFEEWEGLWFLMESSVKRDVKKAKSTTNKRMIFAVQPSTWKLWRLIDTWLIRRHMTAVSQLVDHGSRKNQTFRLLLERAYYPLYPYLTPSTPILPPLPLSYPFYPYLTLSNPILPPLISILPSLSLSRQHTPQNLIFRLVKGSVSPSYLLPFHSHLIKITQINANDEGISRGW